MKNPEKTMFLFLILASTLTTPTISKSTIEPCSSTKEKCNSLLGYNLYTDLKPNQLASLFNVDPISILLSNSIEISDHVLPSNLFLKIPISCSCVDGIMKSTSTRYMTRVSDTLETISGSIYGGLVSPEQILAANPTLSYVDGTVKSTSTHYRTRDFDAVGTDSGSIYGGLVSPEKIPANIPTVSYVDGIAKSTSTHYRKRDSDMVGTISGSVYGGFSSPEQSLTAKAAKIEVGTTLVIPLPCACFNGTDDSSPAVYMSYVVRRVDTMSGIAKRFETTVADLINVNAMGAPDINPGDILAVPLLACGSNFPKYATDYGLIIPNGSYALTAEHCVQCSCSLGSRSMYCEPSSLDVSCSSMQCRNSKFMLGNITSQETSAGCKLTTCTYNGFANGTILTTLSMSLQPRCPGPLQITPLLPPPDTVPKEPMYPPSPSPSPSPSEESDSGVVSGISSVPAASPRASTVASSNSIPGNPANGPGGSISTATCSSSYYSVLMYIASSCSFLVFLVG